MHEHGHIYKPFDAELRALKDQVLAMGWLVESHVMEATHALVDRTPGIAQRLEDADRAVNQMELAIDEQCIRMLALRQPAASDLRFIAATLKIVTDLERIGDLAVNMAERADALAAEPPLRPLMDMDIMAAAAQKMLRGALDAFVNEDAQKARAVQACDADVDRMLANAFTLLRGEMEQDSTSVNRCLSLLFFAKHLERMADHATNIAEMAIFLVEGRDVRHPRVRREDNAAL